MDLYAQLRFLHFSGGFSEQQIFNTLIVRPTKAGDPKAARRLQVLMAEVCLRRRKDMKLQGKDIIELPGKDEYVHKIGILF
jgi:SWI/SNF-related matrix-associated actin-dependent regulator of chromatin subfamily A3